MTIEWADTAFDANGESKGAGYEYRQERAKALEQAKADGTLTREFDATTMELPTGRDFDDLSTWEYVKASLGFKVEGFTP